MTEEQKVRYDQLIALPMEEWPDDLKALVAERTRGYRFHAIVGGQMTSVDMISGGVLYDCVELYVTRP